MYNTTRIVFFSPTHTSARIARAVAEGIGMPRRIETDLTLDENENIIEIKDELTLIAAPVYGGRIAPTALQRIKRLKAENAPAILLAIYGNRDYDDALLELRDTAISLGFTPLSAGAFIGEHSYSTPQLPTAAGRPDSVDLKCAIQFGKDSLQKLRSGKFGILEVKGNYPYKEIPAGRVMPLPESNEQCFGCGECVDICPVHAININNEQMKPITDATRCIRCCACVKECPNGAREYHTPFTAILHEKCNVRREPELFI